MEEGIGENEISSYEHFNYAGDGIDGAVWLKFLCDRSTGIICWSALKSNGKGRNSY